MEKVTAADETAVWTTALGMMTACPGVSVWCGSGVALLGALERQPKLVRGDKVAVVVVALSLCRRE